MAPFSTLFTFEVPFSAIKTISGLWRQVDYTEGNAAPQHILNKRYGHHVCFHFEISFIWSQLGVQSVIVNIV